MEIEVNKIKKDRKNVVHICLHNVIMQVMVKTTNRHRPQNLTGGDVLEETLSRK